MPMPTPEYERTRPLQFGGVLPVTPTYDAAAAVIRPVPFERTTTYGHGTHRGPREILDASSQVELWDEELGVDVHERGLFTLPEIDLSSFSLPAALSHIERVAGEIMDARKFLVTLGGEHSITPPIVAAAAVRHPGLTVLQIDAHADLRESYLGERSSHACAMRRTLEYARLVQVGIRNMSGEEAEALPTLDTRIFYDWNMREHADWIDRVVSALSDTVYITVDVDGLDPGLMPATGTPEPGGLSWRELTALLRRTCERKRVVAADVVELSPVPGLHAPNFVAARLVYKLLTYRLTSPRA
jgi:agmatinase